jgi:hypothetical protein
MKVYFTAAIAQKPVFGPIYDRIIKVLEEQNHQVQHDHITKTTLDDIKTLNDDDLVAHYRKVLKWVTQADIVVVEASFPSTLNIGHEITLALEKGKPVVVLFKKGYSSFFLNGLNSDKLFLVEYTEETLKEVVKESIEYAKDQADTRFNFFISPRHVAYLDHIAKTKKVPRSVYLRQLIEADRAQHQDEYEGV